MNATPFIDLERVDILMETSSQRAQLHITQAQEKKKNGKLSEALKELKQAFELDPSAEITEMLQGLLKEIDTDKTTLDSLIFDLRDGNELRKKEASMKLVQLCSTGQIVTMETLRTLFESIVSESGDFQINCCKVFSQLGQHAPNELTFVEFFTTTTLVTDSLSKLGEKPVAFLFDTVSVLINAMNSKESVQLQLLELLYTICKSDFQKHVQRAAARAIMTSMATEQLALYFFRQENLSLCENLLKDSESKSLLVALLSTCFSKFSEATSKQAQPIIRLLIRQFIDNDVVKGLLMLNAIFLANPSYGSPILMEEGFIDSVVDALDVESEPVQYHTVEMFSSACAVNECRKTIGQFSSLLIPFYHQSKSLRLQLVALLTLVKLVPVSKEASDELLKNPDVIQQIHDIIQSKDTHFVVAALEGLVYLSIHPSIKELILGNTKVINGLKGVLENADRASIYAVCQIFANITTYQKHLSEEEQQVRKLHQMAQSLPPNDPLEDDDAVSRRIDILVKEGLIPVLVRVKSDSFNVLSAISQIFCSIAINQKHRGLMVQCGVIPLLVRYSNALVQHDVLVSCHALAKILITTNPSLACKGELAKEVIRPLVYLLIKSNHGLQQFEALMALTNLAGVGDDIRSRILALDCLVAVENLQFSTNSMIKRASTELLCNLIYHPIVFARYLDPKSGPGLQVMTALSDDDDFATRRAASGALAVLSSEPSSIALLVQQSRFFEIVLNLLRDKETELIHRGAELIKNVFVDAKIAKSVPMNVIDAMKQLTKVPHPAIAGCVKEGLLRAMKLGIKIS